MLVCTPVLVQTGFGNAFHNIAKALVCSRELGARYWPSCWQMDYAAALPPGLVASSRMPHLAKRLRYHLTHRFLQFGKLSTRRWGSSPSRMLSPHSFPPGA